MGNKIDIPGTLHSTATGNVVVETNEVFDTNKGKKQNQLNTEMQSSIDAEIERAAGVEAGLSDRLEAIEELAEISVEGGTLELATSSSDITSGSGKVPTANAVNEVLQGIGYFECSTNADVAAKTIAATGYSLRVGGNIRIKMTNANTADAVTLNINGTGAKALFYNGAQASSTNSWEAGEVVEVYYDGTQYQCGGRIVDDEPTAGSNNLVKSGGVAEELALGAIYDVSAKNPTSGHNNDGKWESLFALLSDANLNTLIPVSMRKGGMSIKFIKSSDNIYVQYKYTNTDATTNSKFTNVNNWVKDNIITDETNGSNYVYVLLDSQKRILVGIKSDLTVDWFLDVPSNLKTILNEINSLLLLKVDKENGKDIISNDVINQVQVINAGVPFAMIDNQKRILSQIVSNIFHFYLHTIVSSLGIENSEGDFINQSWIENGNGITVIDKGNRILSQLQSDGGWFLPLLRTNSVFIKDYFEVSNGVIIGEVLGQKIKDLIPTSKMFMKLHIVSSDEFELYNPNIATGEYIIHGFKHCSYTKDCSAQGGSSNLVCGDMLDTTYVKNEQGNKICQPNMNAIYMIDAENEGRHVGTGGAQGGSHGCEVRNYTYILIDGKQYELDDIFSLTEDIDLSCFEIIQKSHTYKVDAANSSSNTENTPAIENGEPVISTEHWIHIKYTTDNNIEWRNKITIKRDGIKFRQLNMGMLAGFYPYFSECILNDDKNSHVHFEKVDSEMVVTPVGDSNYVRGQWLLGDESTIFGNRYSITQRIKCDFPEMVPNSFIYSVTQDSDSRFKSYFNPVRTTNVPNPQTFNRGDVISVTNIRKINVNKNID